VSSVVDYVVIHVKPGEDDLSQQIMVRHNPDLDKIRQTVTADRYEAEQVTQILELRTSTHSDTSAEQENQVSMSQGCSNQRTLRAIDNPHLALRIRGARVQDN
jgi:hypothetical protein